MRCGLAVVLWAVMVVAPVSGWGQAVPGGLGETVSVSPLEPSPVTEEALDSGVEAEVDEGTPEVPPLPLEGRIGQIMFVTLGGMYRPNNDDRVMFRDSPPGGVVIPSVTRPSHAAEYIRGLRALPIEQRHGLPFFIATNVYALTQHERGPERAFVQMPSMMSLAAAGDALTTQRLATLVGDHLVAMGFNMHLGPPLSLATRLENGQGSLHNFGSDPEFVAEAGGVFFTTFREKGVLGTPMGFPGGGGNRVDGGPAVLLTPRQTLAEQDLAPYIRAIEAGVEVIHVGNTIVPTLDRSMTPASLSRVVIQDLLRGELGFEGLVIAGPVDGPELAAHHTPSEAAMLALLAGADMIYVSQSGRRAMRIVADVAKAIREERLDAAVVDGAYDRVTGFKSERKLGERALPEVKEAKNLEEKQGKLEDPYLIERRAITLVQNRGGVLPLSRDESLPVAVTGVMAVPLLQSALEAHLKKVGQQPIGTARHIRRVQDFEINRLTRYVAGLRTAICIFSNDVHPHGQAKLVSELQARGVRVVVVLLGYPEHLAHYRGADAIVLAYSPVGPLDQTMKAVADILVGRAPVGVLPARRELHRKVGEEIRFDVRDVVRSPMGRLPVTIEAPYVAGFGVTYDPVAALNRAEWDFGNGKRSRGYETTHAYNEAGRYGVTLTVTDKNGETHEGVFHIVVE